MRVSCWIDELPPPMDQTLTTRETPSARIRVFGSHWSSWSVFWLRWYRL